MRFVWTDEGDDPSWGIGDAHGINGYFAPLPFRDPLTKAVLDEAGRRGHVQGIYLGHNWFPGDSPAQLAARVNADYLKLNGAQRKLRVMFNLEEHDPEKVAATLEEWRKLQRNVPTSWSMEGMQGGWMGNVLSDPDDDAPSLFIQRVLATRVRWVPQLFLGGMQRIEGDIVLRDLIRRGVPENIISPFYDAKNLGNSWDGYAFTMGRLPGH